jgi:hypothetical protein
MVALFDLDDLPGWDNAIQAPKRLVRSGAGIEVTHILAATETPSSFVPVGLAQPQSVTPAAVANLQLGYSATAAASLHPGFFTVSSIADIGLEPHALSDTDGLKDEAEAGPSLTGPGPRDHSRITRIVIDRVQSPTFDGLSFGATGQYEKIVGRAFGEVDPDAPQNSIITDIGLAPRNPSGKVEYQTDFYLLKPIDMRRGNGETLYDVNNRGRKFALNVFNHAAQLNDPTTAADAGDGLLMRQGYSLV